jgi:glycosyltransferase involved in cell wall biosynthesis
VTLSVVIITHNEEANLARTLESVRPLVADDKGEIIIVDSGSTDRTVEIAKSFGAKVLVEEWKGYAAQKNSAIDKATGEWILSLDADEEVDAKLVEEITWLMHAILVWKAGGMPVDNDPTSREIRNRGSRYGLDENDLNGFLLPRKNFFLGRWIKHGGFWPDAKLRLFRRGQGRFQDQFVHETVRVEGAKGHMRRGALLHHSYPTLTEYIDHMNRYSSLGAEMAVAKGPHGFSVINIVVRPAATFIYNYFFRLGFLDGREGLLLHLYHAVYVSWKYAKAWELSRTPKSLTTEGTGEHRENR